MGNSCQKAPGNKDEAKISREIDMQIKKDKRAFDSEVKMLLLGKYQLARNPS
jgi:hypothetical protein